MPGLDALPPDHRAVLQLVLAQGRSYDDLAGLLDIGAEAVRARAQAGLYRLGPDVGLDPQRRGELGDYLLGQQTVTQREATRGHLAESAAARAWARAVAAQLRPLAREGLPEIPEEAPGTEPATAGGEAPAPAAPPPPAPEAPAVSGAGPAPASRLGGALLIAGLAILLAVGLIWAFTRGGDDDERASTATTATTATNARPDIIGQINLQGRGDAVGLAQVLSQGGQTAFALVAQNVPANRRGEAYAVWLYSSQRRVRRLGFTPIVGREGNLQTSGPWPRDATRFRELVVSRETSDNARSPGRIILRGPIEIAGE